MCPVCGSESKYRERVKTKPIDYWIFEEAYDHCLERDIGL